ncbi:BadF/BadG/BcrA/BcrD ATPase family protein [Lichenihabitans sp. Uapishka_5]|uniref:BadF/BadG/BcrA/BcrD ATPase family protein n=1 Tax=Lichenihabitans sp. Uapishka_5 TaxID=3037302 RepID=UPI0029E803F5|nr:BadF/BadG/BcrA/BcrD ATPase family protein [Lichenihabitans sp. Uapishka_5]MDX7951905.1 BadF/BadG/BcrA/BcrD ATPase family protein [Lichenihabitans sp. Uapishka_5]
MLSQPNAVFIGVDGGGSRTRVRIADQAGTPIAGAEGGSANVYLAPDTAVQTIMDTIERAALAAGLERGTLSHAALGLGLAGISSPLIAAQVEARFAGRFARVRASDDAIVACLGAHAGRDGGLVIAGTGSAAVVRTGDRQINLGGRGFLLGDDGSGAVMGRQAWRRALRAHDGLEASTPLLQGLMAEFDHDPVAVITWGRHATSSQYGAYAPRILSAAQECDPAALSIANEAASAIEELVVATRRHGARRVSLVGGLAAPLRPFLGRTCLDSLTSPLRDALDGALILAGASFGLPIPD